MNSSVIIERANKEDAPILHEIQRKAFLPDLEVYGDSPAIETLETLVHKIEHYDYYKIVLDGKIVGGFHIDDKGNGIYRLKRIYIDPSIQNSGIGSLVIKKLDDLYPDAKKWTLDTPYKNYRNQHFYEKFGFKKIYENKLNDSIILYEYERIV